MSAVASVTAPGVFVTANPAAFAAPALVDQRREHPNIELKAAWKQDRGLGAREFGESGLHTPVLGKVATDEA